MPPTHPGDRADAGNRRLLLGRGITPHHRRTAMAGRWLEHSARPLSPTQPPRPAAQSGVCAAATVQTDIGATRG